MTKKRWLSIFVENEIGVLARISGLFSGKCYNLDSLTVGTTEDNSISRMTIGLTSDDKTFEQIKKQLNRSVEVIKVIDFTEARVHTKELMYIRIKDCSESDFIKVAEISSAAGITIIECGAKSVLVEAVQDESDNDKLISILQDKFPTQIGIVRGGSVAIEAIGDEY